MADTDTSQDKGDDKVTDPPKKEPPKTPPDDGEKLTITQDELNKMMADNRRNLTKQNEEMAKQLESLQSQINMTQEERDELASTIETLRTQTLSQEELAKREQKKQEDAHKAEVQRLSEELTSWKTRYERETNERALLDAAMEAEAYDASQIVSILGPKTRLTKVKNEESGEESLQPITAFDHVDEEGKPKQLEISPREAVKLMKETKKFQNLFLAQGSAGLGRGANVGEDNGEPNMTNMADYMKWREKNKQAAFGGV